MIDMISYLEEKQTDIAKHRLFEDLKTQGDFMTGMSFVPKIALWVICFQDILRLNESQITQPALLKVARHHRAEDAGHEQWFLQDVVNLLGGMDVSSLYRKDFAPVRSCTHQLVAEVFRAEDDVSRIVLLLALEAAGHVFFENVAGFVRRHGKRDQLRYFSDYHLEVEKNHEVFEQRMMDELKAVRLDAAARATAKAVVDRVFSAFDGMFTEFSRSIRQAAAVKPREFGAAADAE